MGVAIYFCVKKQRGKGCRIHYKVVQDYANADEKLEFVRHQRLEESGYQQIRPNLRHDWLGEGHADFNTLLPIADKKTKVAKIIAQERSIFKLFSLGLNTARDEWVYDRSPLTLAEKMRLFIKEFEATRLMAEKSETNNVFREYNPKVKWSRNLKARLLKGQKEEFAASYIMKVSYRPFTSKLVYASNLYIDELGSLSQIFPSESSNTAICFSHTASRTDYCVLAIYGIADLHFGAAVDIYQQVPRYRFVGDQRVDNITDWALAQFHGYYVAHDQAMDRPITKDSIFSYVYAVLYDPLYREAYALDLKREFPRLPFYADFWRWAKWGEALLALHLGYETAEPWPLRRVDVPDERSRRAGLAPRPILKADKAAGVIVLDGETQLTGVPPEAWAYRLGNRTALEWVLDQHKERTPKDPTIRARFNTYRFADHKERVVDLLTRVTRVSVETVAIVEAMRQLPRPEQGETGEVGLSAEPGEPTPPNPRRKPKRAKAEEAAE